MAQPDAPKTFSPQELREMKEKLGRMRHEVNNQLSLIVAAMEMIRFKPETTDRMMETLAQQPLKIQDEMARYSDDFERTLGFTHDLHG
jgi:hypothetical protein